MDKLDAYLDQVCRGVGGPRELRQHLRQELREHLLDAAAEYRSQGLTQEQALARALEDFGGSEQVRHELEATHGHRVMAVIIDKAMQWKETTMKAKWLWTTWAHVMLLLAIALETAFIAAALVFIVPKFKQLADDGIIGAEEHDARALLNWSSSVFDALAWLVNHGGWALLALAAIWLLFEWRVRSDNKTAIRLSALGTAAVGLLVGVVLLAAALVLPMIMTLPAQQTRQPEPVVANQLRSLELSLAELEQARAARDWRMIQERAGQASRAADTLARMGAAAPAIVAGQHPDQVDALRTRLKQVSQSVRELRAAAYAQDSAALDVSLQRSREAYKPLVGPATRPAR